MFPYNNSCVLYVTRLKGTKHQVPVADNAHLIVEKYINTESNTAEHYDVTCCDSPSKLSDVMYYNVINPTPRTMDDDDVYDEALPVRAHYSDTALNYENVEISKQPNAGDQWEFTLTDNEMYA